MALKLLLISFLTELNSQTTNFHSIFIEVWFKYSRARFKLCDEVVRIRRAYKIPHTGSFMKAVLSEKSVMHVEESQTAYNIRTFASVLHIADCKSFNR
jgi:hypothetical protein